ncbi:GNAT family N-acetyltransferase [Bosea sp. F3-2]|uniref:GNAT family N-acetyltransferase n=1 Tax=Bosea sp. F3-2 TaxID=2599640 RepID=UPI0011EF77DF|nr:GNAT family N-acetyltransferase [Bosea sp. F3-2]QEL23679.1 GNAT family N-acetyltransferase [Bosea sp. F3-2]
MSASAEFTAVDGRKLEIVTSEARLTALAPAWDTLWRQADGLVFQSHGWINAWWRTTPGRDQRGLLIGLVWNGENLEAVLPFATIKRRGIRILEWAAKEHSDYGDILVAPGWSREAAAALWRAIAAAGRFDMAYLNRLVPEAVARQILTGDNAALRLRPNHRSEINYRVSGSWNRGALWFEQQSKKTRQNYRRGRKFMEESGEVRFRLMSPEEPLEPVLLRVAALKRKWLERHGHASDLFDEGSPALAALVGVMAKLGILRVFLLECGDSVVAVSINLVQRDRMMAFVTTYDPDHERASPGMVLMMDYIQWSIDQGLSMVDFLCGGEDFKRRFATQAVTLDSVSGARTLLGRLAVLADGAQHAIRSRRAPAQAADEPEAAGEPLPSRR